MRRSVRYSVSTGVGIAVTMIVSVFAHGESSHSLIILSLPVVYAVTTSLLLAHRQQWFELNQAHAADSKLGAVGGGVGAFTGGALLRVSTPAGIAGLGLMLLGMAITVANIDLSAPASHEKSS